MKLNGKLWMTLALMLCVCASVSAREKFRPREKPKEAPTSTDTAPSDGPLSMTAYDVLLKRNIFSREQPRIRVALPPPVVRSDVDIQADKDARDKAAAARGDSELVLMGLVVRNDERLAVLEDRRSGKIVNIRPGEILGSGKVGEISMEGLEFVAGEKTVRISIGSNLMGHAPAERTVVSSTPAPAPVPALAVPPAGGTPGTTTEPNGAAVTPAAPANATTGGAGAADEAGLSTLEKLRRKRLKEQNK